jgi:apolipoprotein D and lipocalin family protein
VAASTAAATVAILAARAAKAEPPIPLRTVPSVDLGRYMGTWYEIARYPNRFQRKCEGDTTAKYSLLKDGKIEVVNSCRKRDGKLATSKGTAKVVDTKSNARLKVTFFWPFSGDYWIIGLGRNYDFAVVGEPSRKCVWILSRTPEMSPAQYNEAVRIVRDAGYDPSRLIRTSQAVGAVSAA